MTDNRIYTILSVPGGPRYVKQRGIKPDHLRHLLTRGLVLMNTGVQPDEYTDPTLVQQLGIPLVADMQYHEWSIPKWGNVAGKLFKDGFMPYMIIYIVKWMDEIVKGAFHYGRCKQFIEDFKRQYPVFNNYLVTAPWLYGQMETTGIPTEHQIHPDIEGWGVSVLKAHEERIPLLRDNGQKFLGYWTDPELTMQSAFILQNQAKWLREQGAMAALVQTGETGFFELVERDALPGEMMTKKLEAMLKGCGF